MKNLKILILALVYTFNILAFSNESDMTCDQSPNSSDTKSIDRISITFSYPPERGRVNKKSKKGPHFLTGVQNDGENSRIAANNLFGTSGKHSYFTDSMFNPLPPDLEVQSEQDMLKDKKEFLMKMKEVSKQTKNTKALFYSGHGVRCEDPKTKLKRWCILLPMRISMTKKDLGLISYDPVSKEAIHNLNKPYLVTEEELIKATGAKYLILDACHSNQATQYIKTKQELNSTVVISSALSSIEAMDDINKGGRLLHALSNLDNIKSDPIACKLDIDGDGEISLREIVFSMQVNLLSRRNNSLLDYEKLDISKIKNKPVDSNHVINAEIDMMFSGHFSNKCIAVISRSNQCLSSHPIKSRSGNSCSNLYEKHQFFNQQVNKLLSDPATQSEINDLFPDSVYNRIEERVGQSYKAVGFSDEEGEPSPQPTPSGARNEGQYLFDIRLKEGADHLDDWNDDLNKEVKMCRVSDDSYCEVRDHRTELFSKIKDVMQIIKYGKYGDN